MVEGDYTPNFYLNWKNPASHVLVTEDTWIIGNIGDLAQKKHFFPRMRNSGIFYFC